MYPILMFFLLLFFSTANAESVHDDCDAAIEYNGVIDQANYYFEQAILEPQNRQEHIAKAIQHANFVFQNSKNFHSIEKKVKTSKIKKKIKPYLISNKHPAKPILDSLFSQSRVTANLQTLINAGFEVLHIKESSYVIIARHPQLPGYLLKLYLDSDQRTRKGKPSWQWLMQRCQGANIIRKLIAKKKIKNFVVPDKWLYELPTFPNGSPNQHLVLAIVTDMQLASSEEREVAWQTHATKAHLDELYQILSRGSGSNFLSSNVPLTKSGKFAFVDTEYPKRRISLYKVKWYISPSLHPYWDKLTRKKT